VKIEERVLESDTGGIEAETQTQEAEEADRRFNRGKPESAFRIQESHRGTPFLCMFKAPIKATTASMHLVPLSGISAFLNQSYL
jgi:hypothetical protein